MRCRPLHDTEPLPRLTQGRDYRRSAVRAADMQHARCGSTEPPIASVPQNSVGLVDLLEVIVCSYHLPRQERKLVRVAGIETQSYSSPAVLPVHLFCYLFRWQVF